MYVYCNTLYTDDREPLGTFSSHWAACAAMIRMNSPDFKSLGKEKPEDLETETKIKEGIKKWTNP